MEFFKHFHDEFGWLLWGLVILGFIWFFAGGAMRDTAHEGLYLKPPAPLDSGEAYGKYYSGDVGTTTPTIRVEKLDLPEWPADFIRAIVIDSGKFSAWIKSISF